MKRLFFVLAALSLAMCTSSSMAQEPTPTPRIERFADFDGNRYIETDDLLRMTRAWYQAGLAIPEGPRGRITGFLTLGDTCGNCSGTPEDFWVFITGTGGEFITKTAQDGTFQFEGIPIGTYRLIAGGMGDRYCHAVVESVPVSEGVYNLGEVCLAPDLGAQCSGSCPVDTWAVTFIAQEFGGAGIWALKADGTIVGTMTFQDDEQPPNTAQTNVNGTYSVGENCSLSFDVTVSPRTPPGDCMGNGNYSSTDGQIMEFCTEIEGTWTSNATFNCGGQNLPGPAIGAFAMAIPSESKGTETVPLFQAATAVGSLGPPSVEKGGTGDAMFDLNDDGRMDAADLLLLVAQWHVRIPDGPTCTPLPTCTSTPTEDGNGGTPGPTPTLDPALLEGWWEFDWHLAQPVALEWTSLINLGDPGEIESFDSQDLFDNVTMTYTYDRNTGEFVMQVEGEMSATGATGSFAFEASGDMNAQETIITNGTFEGTLQGTLGSRAMNGTFEAYKCCVEGENLNCDCNRPPKRKSPPVRKGG